MQLVVVTGASGFLGTAVVQTLAACGVTVVPVARRPILGGVRVKNYADSPRGDVLIHLAEERDRSNAEIGGNAYEKSAFNTLHAIIDKGWQRVIYASSAVLYGDEHVTPRRPGDPVLINDTYTRMKRAGEEIVLSTEGGIVVRLANLYGPSMASNNVVSTILAQSRGSLPVRVWDATPVRDFLWIADAAEAIAAMAMGEPTVSEWHGIYNVGSGIGISIGELAHCVLEIVSCKERPVISTHPQRRHSCLILDISNTIKTWRWQPRVSLHQGLAKLQESFA